MKHRSRKSGRSSNKYRNSETNSPDQPPDADEFPTPPKRPKGRPKKSMSSEQSPIISVTSSGKRKVDDDEAASPHIPRLRPRRNVSINYNVSL
ncbi:unnamed protein product, partial [Hymenolepis diminuta]